MWAGDLERGSTTSTPLWSSYCAGSGRHKQVAYAAYALRHYIAGMHRSKYEGGYARTVHRTCITSCATVTPYFCARGTNVVSFSMFERG